MEQSIWYTVALVATAAGAFYFGLKIGSSQTMDALLTRAKSRMKAEEFKEFKALLVSLLLKE